MVYLTVIFFKGTCKAGLGKEGKGRKVGERDRDEVLPAIGSLSRCRGV